MSKQDGIRINDPGNGLPVAQFGTFPDGTTALKIAKPGNDVRYAPNSQLIFNSNQDVFKIVISDTYTFPAIGGVPPLTENDQQFSVAHNLGTVPAFLTFLQVNNGGNPVTTNFPSTYFVSFTNSVSFGELGANANLNTVYVGVDSANLYLSRSAYNGDNSKTYSASPVTVRYYILQETAI